MEVPALGERVGRLALLDAWVVDPGAGESGPADLLVEDGVLLGLERGRGAGTDSHGTATDSNGSATGANGSTRASNGLARVGGRLIVAPGFLDLHAHLREPGTAGETVGSGLAAAAHGGFTRVCAMPNTDPPLDEPGGLARLRSAAERSGSVVRLLPYGCSTAGRSGSTLAALGELADAGVVGFSDDGAPISDPALLRDALLYAGALGRPVVEHAEDLRLTEGAEAHEGLAQTVLGLCGWPAAGETAAVARDLEILGQAVREAPPNAKPRLHLTHLSCAGSIDLVRRAKRAGLPVTCDVTPHHLALHDGWLGGDRRFAWQVDGGPWAGGPAEGLPYDPATRVNPPLREPSDAAALAAGLLDGTVDAVATDHAPHPEEAKAVEFGEAAPGISGIETALGLLLAMVEAGVVDLATVIRALTVGPTGVLDGQAEEAGRLVVGQPADLVLVDPRDGWEVTTDRLRSHGANTPLLGRRLPGRVLVTIAGGRLAYLDEAFAG